MKAEDGLDRVMAMRRRRKNSRNVLVKSTGHSDGLGHKEEDGLQCDLQVSGLQNQAGRWWYR